MLKISDIKIPADKSCDLAHLKKRAAKVLRISEEKIKKIEIAKQSVDARDKTRVHYNIAVKVTVENEGKYLSLKNVSLCKNVSYAIPKVCSQKRPVVIGFGPGGMFAGLVLARAGLRPLIFERGSAVEQRQRAIDSFWKNGKLNVNSNVQFGEGGAGTFSDGKLTTGIKDERCSFVLDELVKHGAPEDIRYLAKPHIGTDRLVNVVRSIRNEIISLGGEIHFESNVSDFVIENGVLKSIVVNDDEIQAEYAVLAIGHSARDTFEVLNKRGVSMVQKPFAMGVRIEHSQSMINEAQYGRFAQYLPAADYKLVAHLPNGRSAYTFCMCPGGVVAGAASEEGGVVTNGMSYYARAGKNANAALLIGINTSDFGSDYVLAGVELQRKLERKAFEVGGGNYYAPVQCAGDILEGIPTQRLGSIEPTYRPGVTPSDFRKIFPQFMYESFALALYAMDKKIKGFACPDAVLTAVESRSSSPVRILRGEDFNSIRVKGLIPCGEGCGYAGGIMSAAVDGVKCAEAILKDTKTFS